jgi:hypothetical protein
MPMTYITTTCAVAALLISALSFFRSSSDRRIDERIDLKLKADIAVMKRDLATIKETVTQQSAQTSVVVRAAVEATAEAIRGAADAIAGATRS